MIILQHRFPTRSQVPRYICRFSYFFFLNLVYLIAVQLAHTAPVVTVVARALRVASSPSQRSSSLRCCGSAAPRSAATRSPSRRSRLLAQARSDVYHPLRRDSSVSQCTVVSES
eukprot:2300451-Pleurochrysis_carterae.AAC.1